MKSINLIFILLVSLAASAKPDPAAKKILAKSESIYKSYKSLEVEFQIENKAAESKSTYEKGLFQSKGNAFKIISDKQEIFNDGSTQWTFLKSQKEIQINNSGKEKGLFNPLSLLDMYKSSEYDYRLDEDLNEKGISYHQVDFKPMDRNQDIFKIKIAFDKKKSTIHKVFIYHKNGDKVTLHFKKSSSNKNFAADNFTLNTKLYPNIHIEDLRE
ncbi:MAG: outer membrane lipoprotein carrier protein LolA [Saprospiraceae bacterium]